MAREGYTDPSLSPPLLRRGARKTSDRFPSSPRRAPTRPWTSPPTTPRLHPTFLYGAHSESPGTCSLETRGTSGWEVTRRSPGPARYGPGAARRGFPAHPAPSPPVPPSALRPPSPKKEVAPAGVGPDGGTRHRVPLPSRAEAPDPESAGDCHGPRRAVTRSRRGGGRGRGWGPSCRCLSAPAPGGQTDLAGREGEGGVAGPGAWPSSSIRPRRGARR